MAICTVMTAPTLGRSLPSICGISTANGMVNDAMRRLRLRNFLNQEGYFPELLIPCFAGFRSRSEEAQDLLTVNQDELARVGFEQARALLLEDFPLSLKGLLHRSFSFRVRAFRACMRQYSV